MQVRRPSGTFGLAQADGDTLLVPRALLPSKVQSDMMIVVYVESSGASALACEDGTSAGALTSAVEEGTGRPLLGVLFMCTPFSTDFNKVLEVALHEVLHILGWSDNLIPQWWAYSADGPLAGQNVTAELAVPGTGADAPGAAPAAAPVSARHTSGSRAIAPLGIADAPLAAAPDATAPYARPPEGSEGSLAGVESLDRASAKTFIASPQVWCSCLLCLPYLP